MAKPKVSYYLDKPKEEESQIFLRITNRGERILIATGKKIPTKYWVKEQQRIKRTTAYPINAQLNHFLNSLAGEAERIILDAENCQQAINKDFLKIQINTYLGKGGLDTDGKDSNDFFAVLNNFIELQKRKKSSRTIQKYNTLKNQLLDFEKKKRVKLRFEDLDLQIYDKLEDYYYGDRKALDSTWEKYLKTLKTFLNWATERGYNTNLGYKKFKAPKLHDTDDISLTQDELNTLYNLDLSQNQRLAKVRDVFCFGCFTGLRFSDIEALRKEDIKGEHMFVKAYKTKLRGKIPLSPNALQIVAKYINAPNFLPTITNQKSNVYLKELGKIAGIDETIVREQYSGSKRIKTKKPKYEFISTHTARRTFVTLSLEKGIRHEVVMEITGHKDYKTFKKYIKLTSKVVDNEMKKIWNDENNNPFMKVAN